MKLLVISHKEVWKDEHSPSGFATVGGFPYQMRALAVLFDATRVLVMRRAAKPVPGLTPLVGKNLVVTALPEPHGSGWRRKLNMVGWLIKHTRVLWKEIGGADAVHCLVPGDVGLIGLILSLLQRKPLFVRHCGTWAKPLTVFDRFTFWLLERIAGGRNVVLATGGGSRSPSAANANIRWIFSSVMAQSELQGQKLAETWRGNGRLRLVSVSRLAVGKNVHSILEALPILQDHGVDAELTVVGDGAERAALEQLARSLNQTEKVSFTGNIPHAQVLQRLAAAHLFVFPTRVNEGFPKALLEAMACGLPVVASPVSVIPDLIGDDAGMLLKGSTPGDVARGIMALTADVERMSRMGSAAREKARAYTLEGWSDQIRMALETGWAKPLMDEPTG